MMVGEVGVMVCVCGGVMVGEVVGEVVEVMVGGLPVRRSPALSRVVMVVVGGRGWWHYPGWWWG